jgi:transcriptional regulator with XRE-family HTH domain
MPRKLKDLPEIEADLTQKIGNRISAIRKKRGITQIQLAEAVGITQKLVSSYEVGRITLSAEMLLRLAKSLGTTADEILGLKDQSTDVPALSLRLMKRMSVIEKMPEIKKKHILRTLDDSIKANSPESSSSLE